MTLTQVDYTHPVGGAQMAIQLFHAAEVANAAGISKPTLLRWIKSGRIADASKRDRNGWRVFNSAEVEKIKRVASAAKRAPQ